MLDKLPEGRRTAVRRVAAPRSLAEGLEETLTRCGSACTWRCEQV